MFFGGMVFGDYYRRFRIPFHPFFRKYLTAIAHLIIIAGLHVEKSYRRMVNVNDSLKESELQL
jgi:hypothetical protein